MSLLELFVDVDDFCQIFLPRWEQRLLAEGSKQRRRQGQLRVSEILTIMIHFHQSHYRDFKVTAQASGATKPGKKGVPTKARRKADRAFSPFLRAVDR